MAKVKSEDIATAWATRFDNTREYFERWEANFRCRQMADYYEGAQWDNVPPNAEPYVANLIYATIEAKLPGMAFINPKAVFKPKPSKTDWNPDKAYSQAKLREDACNQFLADPNNDFTGVVEQGIIDAQFRFGIVEVGYDASWIVNPKAPRPILASDNNTEIDSTNDYTLADAKTLPDYENIYVRNINPRRFRICGNSRWKLENNDWCGYWEYQRISDLKAVPAFKNKLDNVLYANAVSSDFVGGLADEEEPETRTNGDCIKILHIFDLRAKKRHVIAYAERILLASIDFVRCPLKILRYSRRAKVPDSFYPIPPASQWKSAQDEYNEAKEQLRSFRKRFLRKFIIRDGSFLSEEEIDKLMDGFDGTCSTVVGSLSEAIQPVPLPTVGAEVMNAMATSRDDFNTVSGTSAEQRLQADRQTATQSKIIDARTSIRESRINAQTSNWINEIITEIAKLQAEKLTLPFWVKVSAQTPGTFQEMQNIQAVYQQIDPVTDLDENFDFDVEVSLSTISPIENEREKNAFFEFLAALNQYPQLAFSPELIRHLAEKVDVRAESVIIEAQKMALVAQLGQQAQAEDALNQMASQRTMAAATPPNMEQVTNTMQNQVGLPTDMQGAA
jgi:hypothetical protein